jgi:RluA family pseudouridine synthase
MAFSLELPILWIDDAIIAVNKPPGLRTIRDGYDPTMPYLSAILSERYGRLWVVHRLDKETSGVIVLARTPESHRLLNLQFDQRQVAKLYHAIVIGAPQWEKRNCHLPLCINGDRRHRTVVDAHKGKLAFTELEVLERFQDHALIAARPHTGYTHQIRAHLNAIGFSILGDSLYTAFPAHPGRQAQSAAQPLPCCPLLQRLGLHAHSITFTHPLTQTDTTLEAPYHAVFEQALKWLRENSGLNPTLT